jgi:hypothetical protein
MNDQSVLRDQWQRFLAGRRAAWRSIWFRDPPAHAPQAPLPEAPLPSRDRGIAVLLAVLLGPVGLCYVDPRRGVVWTILALVLMPLTYGLGTLVLWIMSIAYAGKATRPPAVVSVPRSTEPPPWEYRQIELGRGPEADEEALNEAGREGWEVVNVMGTGRDRTAYCKRQRP